VGNVSVQEIAERIVVLRGLRVMVDSELALLYRVTTKRLNEQVKRNRDRFPDDFMFQLNAKERDVMWSQIATTLQRSGSALATHAVSGAHASRNRIHRRS
jgi:hypothetical protein